jgi:hypothetical protein
MRTQCSTKLYMLSGLACKFVLSYYRILGKELNLCRCRLWHVYAHYFKNNILSKAKSFGLNICSTMPGSIVFGKNCKQAAVIKVVKSRNAIVSSATLH